MTSSDIHIGPQSDFHMLRHFTGITLALREKLLNAGRTPEAIEKELTEPGSRFNPDFAHDIVGLLDRILKDGYEETIGANGNLVWMGKADPTVFPEGAGTLSVVPLDSIPEDQRSQVYFSKNRRVDLLHFKVDSLPTTPMYTLILKPTQQRPVFITAFPGPPAMPLPEHSMEKSLYEKCKTYWDGHVFLVEE